MSSATRQATINLLNFVQTVTPSVEDARAVFAVTRAIAQHSALKTALADPVAPKDAKAKLVQSLFAGESVTAVRVLDAAVRERWSNAAGLIDGLEEAAITMSARAAIGVQVAEQITSFGRTIANNSELELAIGGALRNPEGKSALVTKLLEGKASPAAIAILDHTVRLPRGRRIGQLIRRAAATVAAANGAGIATVTTAAALPPAQLDRLAAGLRAKYGPLQVQQIIDPSIIGGLRVAVANDIIDGTVRSKFNDLRLQLG